MATLQDLVSDSDFSLGLATAVSKTFEKGYETLFNTYLDDGDFYFSEKILIGTPSSVSTKRLFTCSGEIRIIEEYCRLQNIKWLDFDEFSNPKKAFDFLISIQTSQQYQKFVSKKERKGEGYEMNFPSERVRINGFPVLTLHTHPDSHFPQPSKKDLEKPEDVSNTLPCIEAIASIDGKELSKILFLQKISDIKIGYFDLLEELHCISQKKAYSSALPFKMAYGTLKNGEINHYSGTPFTDFFI